MIEIRETPLTPHDCLEAVRSPGSGGAVLFVGSVRDMSDGTAVEFLEYEAYVPMALSSMKQLVEEARLRWPIQAVAIQHRVGRLTIGEDAVAIAVACPHRAEAFEACRFIIDRLKEVVPIWKKEHDANGAVWVGGPTLPVETSSRDPEPG